MAGFSSGSMLSQNTVAFPDNTTGLITPAILRTYNADLINSVQFTDVATPTASLALDSEKLGGLLPTAYVLTSSYNPFTSSINAFTASSATSASNALITASVSSNVITFTKGGGTTFAVTVGSVIDTGSFTTTSSFNAYTGSTNAFTASMKTFTGSIQTQVNALQAATSSYNTNTVFNAYSGSTNAFSASMIAFTASINSFTASSATSASNALVTASVSSNVVTFTKGNGTTFNLTVATGSAVTVNTGSLLTTASFSNPSLTFTKGDGTTFTQSLVTLVPTSASFATSASYASNVGAPAGLVSGSSPNSMKSAAFLTATPATSSGTSSIALGNNAISYANYSVIIGDGAHNYDSARENSVYIGRNASGAQNSIAIGYGASALSDSSVVLGRNASGNADNNVTIGYNANSSDGSAGNQGGITIGRNTQTRFTDEVNIGNRFRFNSGSLGFIQLSGSILNPIVTGSLTVTGSISLTNRLAFANTASGGVIISNYTGSMTSQKYVLIGNNINDVAETGIDNVQIGNFSKIVNGSRDNIVVIGANSKAAQNTVCIGGSAEAEVADGVVVGKSARATQNGAVAVGKSADAQGTDSIAIGISVTTAATNEINIGNKFKFNSGSNGIINLVDDTVVSGSLTATSFTGSLFGTASFAITASHALNAGGGAAFPFTGSAAISGSLTIRNVDDTFMIISSSTTNIFSAGPRFTGYGGTTFFESKQDSDGNSGNMAINSARDLSITVPIQFSLVANNNSSNGNFTIGTNSGNGCVGNFTIAGNKVGDTGSIFFTPNTAGQAGVEIRKITTQVQFSDYSQTTNGFVNFMTIDANSTSSVNPKIQFKRGMDITGSLTLTAQDPLPGNLVGSLAVSGSNLYYNNGSNWTQIN